MGSTNWYSILNKTDTVYSQIVLQSKTSSTKESLKVLGWTILGMHLIPTEDQEMQKYLVQLHCWEANLENLLRVLSKYAIKYDVLTSGKSPVLLLDGKWGTDPSRELSTVVKQILYS